MRRFGRGGAAVVEAVSAGLWIRDVSMIASGAPGRLRRGPAVLLWLEAIVAAYAVATGLPPVANGAARRQASAPRPGSSEIARRAAVGSLFALHTTRFWIYLRPDQGRRPPARNLP